MSEYSAEVKALFRKCLDEKWLQDNALVADHCAFCEDAQGDCSGCKCPPEFCNEGSLSITVCGDSTIKQFKTMYPNKYAEWIARLEAAAK